MKFIYTILVFFLCGSYVTSVAQQPLNQMNILSFTVKSKLPADISTWNTVPASMMLVAQKSPQVQISEVKLVLQILLDGKKICGNTSQSAVVSNAFAIRNFSANELLGLLTPCNKLATGTYSLCAQFFNVDNYPISRPFCKDFTVGEIQQTYNAPQNIAPVNEKKFDEFAIKTPITFRWLPVLPKPKDAVVYKLRIWQLMQGQTGTQAMKANEPIIQKEITNINQAIIANVFNNPCKPPYLCDYVWNVQALDKEGKPTGNKDGMSELYSFSVKQDEWEHIKLLMPENKKTFLLEDADILFKWTAFKPKPNNPLIYRLRIWQLMQGQKSLQAFRNNKPIITKYIENVEEVSLKNIISSKCIPPFSCNFIWTVQALGADGNPLDEGENNFNEFIIK
jgi:hypothetical protein